MILFPDPKAAPDLPCWPVQYCPDRRPADGCWLLLSVPGGTWDLVQGGITGTVLYCIVLWSNVLYCTVLYCNLLWSTVLYWTVMQVPSQDNYCLVSCITVQQFTWDCHVTATAWYSYSELKEPNVEPKIRLILNIHIYIIQNLRCYKQLTSFGQ